MTAPNDPAAKDSSKAGGTALEGTAPEGSAPADDGRSQGPPTALELAETEEPGDADAQPSEAQQGEADATQEEAPPETKREPRGPSVAATELDLSARSLRAPLSTGSRGVNESAEFERKSSPETVQLRRVTLASTQESEEGPAPSPDAYMGYIIDGRYHVQSMIAQGGMGVVYLARHRLIDKTVAIKILRRELVNDREITQRFLTEAQAASAIGSDHIVDITDYGELPDGATYIVMEYLEGISLSERVRSGDPLEIEEILSIGRQLAEALAGAHAARIIHRDLKPDNVLLVPRGKERDFVKILDFGIAKVASSQNQITRAGKIFGTPHYMSPEQAKGEELDRRTDIYSLGVMLYEMTAQQLPFEAENPLGVLTQHMYVEPKPLHEVCDRPIPVGLETIVMKCLAKSPADRYSSMLELEEELARVAEGLEPLAVEELRRRDNTPESLRDRIRASKAQSGTKGVIAGVLIAAALSGAAAWSSRAAQTATAEEAEPSASATAATATETATAGGKTPHRVVALVLSPVDARVYRGDIDLGAMPISVQLRPGRKMELQVRRPGYQTQTIFIDGSESRKVVELRPVPGGPSISVPTSTPDPKTARTISFGPDAGVTILKGAAASHFDDPADAGAPRPWPERQRAPVFSALPQPDVPLLPPRGEWEEEEDEPPLEPPAGSTPPPGPPPVNSRGDGTE